MDSGMAGSPEFDWMSPEKPVATKSVYNKRPMSATSILSNASFGRMSPSLPNLNDGIPVRQKVSRPKSAILQGAKEAISSRCQVQREHAKQKKIFAEEARYIIASVAKELKAINGVNISSSNDHAVLSLRNKVHANKTKTLSALTQRLASAFLDPASRHLLNEIDKNHLELNADTLYMYRQEKCAMQKRLKRFETLQAIYSKNVYSFVMKRVLQMNGMIKQKAFRGWSSFTFRVRRLQRAIGIYAKQHQKTNVISKTFRLWRTAMAITHARKSARLYEAEIEREIVRQRIKINELEDCVYDTEASETDLREELQRIRNSVEPDRIEREKLKKIVEQKDTEIMRLTASIETYVSDTMHNRFDAKRANEHTELREQIQRRGACDQTIFDHLSALRDNENGKTLAPLFLSSFSEKELGTLILFMDELLFEKGQIVVTNGQATKWMGILMEGTFKITEPKTPKEKNGKTKDTYVGPGHLLGFHQALEGGNNVCTIQSDAQSRILSLPFDTIDCLAHLEPSTALRLQGALATCVIHKLRTAPPSWLASKNQKKKLAEASTPSTVPKDKAHHKKKKSNDTHQSSNKKTGTHPSHKHKQKARRKVKRAYFSELRNQDEPGDINMLFNEDVAYQYNREAITGKIAAVNAAHEDAYKVLCRELRGEIREVQKTLCGGAS